MNNITIERSIPFNKTFSMAYSFFSELEEKGFNIETKKFTDFNDPYPTYTTYIRSNDKLITRGNGKGIGEQSMLSSIFEAIEHLSYESYFLNKVSKWKKIHYKSLYAIKSSMDKSYKDTPVYENLPHSNVRIPFITCKNKLQKIDIPLYMMGPSYPEPAYSTYQAKFINSIYFIDNSVKGFLYPNDSLTKYEELEDVRKYSSSVGGATGVNITETKIHALNEIIERDTTSEFTFKFIYYEKNCDYKKIKTSTLNESNRKIAEFMEKKYGVNLQIIDITGKLGIPTIMVVDRDNKYSKTANLTGYGTSLYFDYAIERALLEYKQVLDLVINDRSLPPGDDVKTVYKEANFQEFFMKIYFYDFSIFDKLEEIDYSILQQKYKMEILDTKQMLKYLENKLNKNNYDFYYHIRSYNINKGKVYFVKAIIPQMCDITDIGPVRLPGKRKMLEIKNDLKELKDA